MWHLILLYIIICSIRIVLLPRGLTAQCREHNSCTSGREFKTLCHRFEYPFFAQLQKLSAKKLKEARGIEHATPWIKATVFTAILHSSTNKIHINNTLYLIYFTNLRPYNSENWRPKTTAWWIYPQGRAYG